MNRPPAHGPSLDPSRLTVNGIGLALEADVELHRTLVRLEDHPPYLVGKVVNIDEGAWRPTLKLEAAFIELLGRPRDREQITATGVHAWRARAKRVLELS